MKKGISLIVLVITIIVIVIISQAVILSIVNNNPIDKVEEAVFASDVDTIQSELSLIIAQNQVDTLGSFDIKTMNGKVSDYIPSITKYDDILEIKEGVLIYNSLENKYIDYVKNINIQSFSKYNGSSAIDINNANINKDNGTIEAWVNVNESIKKEIAEKYIFSTSLDNNYTNTIALRHNRFDEWEVIMSRDVLNISKITLANNLSLDWHLFTVKWNNSEIALYIDGNKVGSTAPTLISASTNNFRIGKGPNLNIVENGYTEMKNNYNFTTYSYNTSDYVSSPGSIYSAGNISHQTSKFIPVDVNKNYFQSGAFKSTGSLGNSSTFYGFACYDEKMRFIEHKMIYKYENTKTILAQDLNPGDTVVYLNSATNWKNSTDLEHRRRIAFYPFENYPEYTYTRKTLDYSEANLVNNSIILNVPYTGEKVIAGTKVANTYDGGTFNYSTIPGLNVPNTWTTYTSNITGESTTLNSNQFRYGTKYIKILFLMNYQQSSSYSSMFDNIEFKDTRDYIFDSNIYDLAISNISRSDSNIMDRYTSKKLIKDSNVVYLMSEN